MTAASPPARPWHQRYDDDRARTWLRETAADTVRALFAPRPAPGSPSPADPGSNG
ncbi:hypothetical protein AB0N09_39110 [Streptomyces erythrochromogenes]|uniref:hypothetical protein n=1 Tax=Streptomyces erythrochromogenes TaxID=285574 RepID=UPI0034312C3F